MQDTKHILTRLERRFKSFSQQQFMFVTALDRCRKINFEPNAKITTISQVQFYADEVADNATDKRIFGIFLSLVKDLNEFRRTLQRLIKTKDDKKLDMLFATWKKVLQPLQDISGVRAKFPHDHMNHLSCDEARNHFGGVVSLVPVAMTCAKEAAERIEKTKAYRNLNGTPVERPESRTACCRSRSTPVRQLVPAPANTQEMEEQDETAFQNGNPHGGWLTQNAAPSPLISSPANSSYNSRENLQRPVSRQSNSLRKPTSALPTYCQDIVSRQRPATSVGVQTAKYLGSTVEPNCNWPHQTVSEDEMRKMLRSRQHCTVRPKWKP